MTYKGPIKKGASWALGFFRLRANVRSKSLVFPARNVTLLQRLIASSLEGFPRLKP